jgi:hypothetical protein
MIHYQLKKRDVLRGLRTREQFKSDVIKALRRNGVLVLALFFTIATISAYIGWVKRNAISIELDAERVSSNQWYSMFQSVSTEPTIITLNGTAYFYTPPQRMELPN